MKVVTMHIDVLDQVNELQHEERKLKAILNSFHHEYIEPEKETALRNIEYNHQDYSYTASVILDLVCSVMKKTDDLEKMIAGNTEPTD